MNTAARRALYDNLDRDEALALAVDEAVRSSRQDDWRSNPFKIKRVRLAIKEALQKAGIRDSKGTGYAQPLVVREEQAVYAAKDGEPSDQVVEAILELVKNQNEY